MLHEIWSIFFFKFVKSKVIFQFNQTFITHTFYTQIKCKEQGYF